MLRTTFSAALAAVGLAHEFTPYASLDAVPQMPALTTPLTFLQIGGQENF